MVGEVPLPAKKPLKDDLRIVYKRILHRRQVMQVSLGPIVSGAALPMADTTDWRNQVGGVEARIGRQVPKISPQLIRKLRSFVRIWIHRHLSPLTSILTVEEWLAETDYSEARKQQLRDAEVPLIWISCPAVLSKFLKCVSFLKTETYDDFKWPRAINSRKDAFKVATGPFFHAVEQALFKLPYFVKFVPVADRGSFIWQRLSKWPQFFCSDYTAFETHMVPEVLRTVEFQLYAYMARLLPGGHELTTLIQKALAGRNRMDFRDVHAEIDGVRMSGDMCTSLGNGFTNLMIVLFVCQRHGLLTDGVVEGDDGLFGFNGTPPNASWFTELGFTIKIERHDRLEDAGFCQMFFDSITHANVVDPAKLLCKFGWTHSMLRFGGIKVLRRLLRAKAFSLSCELPACPLSRSLAQLAMRIAGPGPRAWDRGRTPDYWDAYKCRFPRPFVEPSMASRLQVERLFGMPVEDQLAIERYIDGLRSGPLTGELVMKHMREPWTRYWSRYSCKVQPGRIQ